jgi:hypothetical protein
MMYIIGDVYYSVYFVDDELHYPFVGCYVFLGENLNRSESTRTWYFQDCESFARYGSFENDVDGDRQILGLTEDSVKNVISADQLMKELQEAALRRATKS